MTTAWAQEQVAKQVSQSHSLWEGIWNAGIVVQLLLLGLIVLSIYNWIIIFKKRALLIELSAANKTFLNSFWKVTNIKNIYMDIEKYTDSPVANIFQSAYEELERVVNTNEHEQNLLLDGVENVERSMRRCQDDEIEKMEHQLTMLATTGNTATFIGLLGTVIGIMNSFQDIASSGSASLAVVAPGISEALFATAVGLFVAIPAVVAYNYFINAIKKIENQMNGFHSDFLNIARRNFIKSKSTTGS